MPGASSMRGVTGFRVLDALNGALAQLIPDRIPAAGEGGNTLAIFGADRPESGDRFVFYELVVGTWGGTPDVGRQRRPHEPGQPGREHPDRGGRVRVPDRRRAVRARARHGRRRASTAAASRSSASWRCLTPNTSLIVRSDRADRPPYGLAGGGSGRAVEQPPGAPGRDGGGAARDVLDHDRGGRRLRPPDGGRRRLGRPARARPGRGRARRREREGQRRRRRASCTAS